MHPRQVIRDKVVDIVTGLTTTETRVFNTRPYPYDPDKEGGPGLFVFSIDEESRIDSMGPVDARANQRTLSVAIEAVVAVNNTMQDVLDDIAKEIEEAMIAAGNTLGGVCHEQFLLTTRVVIRDQGEIQTGGIVLTYVVAYRVRPDDGELLLEDVENPIVRTTGLTFTFEGNGVDLPVDKYQDLPITFDCVITGWIVVAQQIGSITFGVWSDTYAAFPPTVADSINGTTPPKTVSDDQGESDDVSGWTVQLYAGSVLRVAVVANAGIEDAVLTLKVRRTS